MIRSYGKLFWGKDKNGQNLAIALHFVKTSTRLIEPQAQDSGVARWGTHRAVPRSSYDIRHPRVPTFFKPSPAKR